MESTSDLSVKESTARREAGATLAPSTLQLADVKLDDGLAEKRAELLGEFVGLKHSLGQIRAERDRLVVENRDLAMRLSVVEADYASLFSYVESGGTRA
jgi:hypothetical protein